MSNELTWTEVWNILTARIDGVKRLQYHPRDTFLIVTLEGGDCYQLRMKDRTETARVIIDNFLGGILSFQSKE